MKKRKWNVYKYLISRTLPFILLCQLYGNIVTIRLDRKFLNLLKNVKISILLYKIIFKSHKNENVPQMWLSNKCGYTVFDLKYL